MPLISSHSQWHQSSPVTPVTGARCSLVLLTVLFWREVLVNFIQRSFSNKCSDVEYSKCIMPDISKFRVRVLGVEPPANFQPSLAFYISAPRGSIKPSLVPVSGHKFSFFHDKNA